MKTLTPYLLSTIYYLLFTTIAFAQTTLDGGVVPYKPSDEPTLIVPEKQTMRGLFKGEKYKIQVGFANLETEAPLKLSISENLIDYGLLPPTDPVSRATNVSISAPSSQNYTLQVFQDHSLKHNSSKVFIPDTTCDNGVCSETTAQAWTGTLTYGFGYRCDPSTSLRTSPSNYCLSGFSDTSFYKPFPSEIPQIVMTGNTKSSAQMTFKVNISGTQAPQFYSNKITFIMVPNF